MSDLLIYALRYAELGQPIIPLHWITESGQCSCENHLCKSPGKHPIPNHGIKEATLDKAIIQKWWQQNPNANIGGSCGVLFDAIDVDPRNGGLESVNGDREALDTLLIQQTGGGGFHYLVKPGNALQKRTGVDIKKAGGYIVLEPSLTQAHYYFNDWDVLNEPWPELKSAPGTFYKTTAPEPILVEQADSDQIIELRSALNCFDTHDYERWIRFGLCLKALGSQGRSLFFDWSMQFNNYDPVECAKKWESFKPDNSSYKSIFYEAYQVGWCSNLIINDEINKITFSNADEMAMSAKAPHYLINHILETDSHGMLAGASMAFKSFMALAIAHSICNGVDFFGHRSFGAHKVVYVCGEGRRALSRRMRAVSFVHGGFNNNMSVLDGKIRIDNEQDISAINVEIQRIRPALVIFDTFSSMNSQTNENDNSEVANALGMIHRHLSNGFTSSLIVHHFGKDEEKGLRGASAFTANSDFILLMKRPTESMEADFKCYKTKDGDRFDDISVIARVVDIDLKAQDGGTVTSLILEPISHRPVGRPNTVNDCLDRAFDIALNDEPVVTDSGVGVNRKYFFTVANNLLGKKPESARVMITNYINTLKKQGVITEMDNILIRCRCN